MNKCNNMFILIFMCALLGYSHSAIRDDWIEPDAWGRAAGNSAFKKEDLCPRCECENSDSPETFEKIITEKISLIYYKKLLNFLFSREKLENEENADLFHRHIRFTLTESQVDKLEKSLDPRDWDSVLTEVLPHAQTYRNNKTNTGWLRSSVDFLKSLFYELISLFEIRFEFIMFIAILLVLYLKRSFRASLIVISLSGIFLSGFIYKYYECNRKLETDQLIEMYKDEGNSCDNISSSIWNLWGLFSTKSKAQCMEEYLSKKNKINLPFCRADIVFLSYINEIMLNQFGMTVEKSTKILKDINDKIPFPYNIVASIIFGSTLLTFLGLFFKYIISPQVWCGYFQKRRSNGKTYQKYKEDKISGNNLKTLLEICRNTTENKCTPMIENITVMSSGVQILTNSIDDGIKSIRNNNEEKDIKKTEQTSKSDISEIKDSNESKHLNKEIGGIENESESITNESEKSEAFEEIQHEDIENLLKNRKPNV